MEITLTPELENFVASRIDTGFYKSENEVMREALRTLARQERTREEKFKILKSKIDEGIKAADEGRFSILDENFVEKIKSGALARIKSVDCITS